MKRLISAAAAKVLRTGDSRWSPRHLHFKAPEPTGPDGAGGAENAPTPRHPFVSGPTGVGVRVIRGQVAAVGPTLS